VLNDVGVKLVCHAEGIRWADVFREQGTEEDI